MAKVTSKYQVTVPKAIANEYNIRPGDDIDWIPAGDVIRVVPHGKPSVTEDRESRLRFFDQATELQGAAFKALAECSRVHLARSAFFPSCSKRGCNGRGRLTTKRTR